MNQSVRSATCTSSSHFRRIKFSRAREDVGLVTRRWQYWGQ